MAKRKVTVETVIMKRPDSRVEPTVLLRVLDVEEGVVLVDKEFTAADWVRLASSQVLEVEVDSEMMTPVEAEFLWSEG